MRPTFEYIIDGLILTAVSVFGLVGTLMAVRVLLKPNLRNSFSGLLVGLALCDAHFLALAVLIFGLPKASDYFSGWSVYLSPFCNGLIGMARTGSVYLTMSVTFERYFAIVKPLHHFYAKKYLLPSSLLFAIVYNVPKFWELKREVFPFTNETMIVATSLRENQIYKTVYVFWLKVLFMEAIPYTVIIVLNTLIVLKIRKSKKFRKSIRKQQKTLLSSTRQGQSSKREDPEEIQMVPTNGHSRIKDSSIKEDPLLATKSLNRMESRASTVTPPLSRQEQEISLGITLVFVSVLFIVCQSPKIIPDLYELFCPKDHWTNTECMSTPFIDTIISLSNLLTCINSAANFLVYMLRGKKFRDAFLETYSCRGVSSSSPGTLNNAPSLTAITTIPKTYFGNHKFLRKYSDSLSSSSEPNEALN